MASQSDEAVVVVVAWDQWRWQGSKREWRYTSVEALVVEMKLPQGLTTTFDACFLETMKQHSWRAPVLMVNKSPYAVTTLRTSGSKQTVLMHRLICGLTHEDKGLKVDHKDGQTLNNTKANLRITDDSGNMHNKRMTETNTSGVNGVHHVPKQSTFVASIRVAGVRISTSFAYGIRSLRTKEQAWATAVAKRKQYDEEYGSQNGKRPKRSQLVSEE